MKKTVLTIAFGLSLLLFSGCSSSTEDSEAGTSFDVNSNGNIIITDNVIATFEQSLEAPQKCNIYSATIKSISADSMNEYFFNGKAQKTIDSDDASILFELENRHGILSDNSFVFYTDNGNKYDDAASYFLNDPNASLLDNSAELSFATKEATESEIITFLEQVGLESDKAIIEKAYGISKENFDEYKTYLSKTASEENDPKISFQAENVSKITSEDFYYFDIGFSENEIPIYSGGAYYYGEGENDTFAGTRFTIVYTKNGIEYVSAFFLYQTDDIIETHDIIEFSEAKALLKNKYENIFFDSTITFDKAELVYLPFPQNTLNERFKNFVLRPYYAFYGYQSAEIGNEKYRSDFTVYFDAVTGKEL